MASRGKGPDFWQPYVEEWQNPPSLDPNAKSKQFVKKWFGLFIVKRSMFSDLTGDVIDSNFNVDSSSVYSTGLPIYWSYHLFLV